MTTVFFYCVYNYEVIKILCSCNGHQDAMWHHGFVTIINVATCSIFG
jgi:hypothetical protein